MKKTITVSVMAIAMALAALSYKDGVAAKRERPHAIGSNAEIPRPATQEEEGKPTRITAAEAKHIVAYYRKADGKLYVYNQKAFANWIEKRMYKVTGWTPGAAQATLSMPATRSTPSERRMNALENFRVPVVYRRSAGTLEGEEPKLGDTKFVEYAQKLEKKESISTCLPSSVKLKQYYKKVWRAYTYLDDEGDQSGQESFQTVVRVNYYAVKDCSRGFLAAEDRNGAWTLTVQAWPNP